MKYFRRWTVLVNTWFLDGISQDFPERERTGGKPSEEVHFKSKGSLLAEFFLVFL